MENEKLIVEIIDICIEFNIIKNHENIEQRKVNLASILEDAAFVEILYCEIFKKARQRKLVNTDRIKQVLLGLEKIRLELEPEKENIDTMKDKEFKVH
ncbi:MAG: hypothetical protein FWE14_08040 [Lachnospiraceae bacterium]|nr:hypothetical protein [Lachnospiraceae bacterium]